MLMPKKNKFKKQFKGKIKGKTFRGNVLTYGQFAIKSCEEGRITAKQIEATRRVIVRKMKRLGFLWIRIFPDTPVTSKPTENRMGKGKGAVSHWVSKVKKGQILIEICYSSKEHAKEILLASSSKLPIKIVFTTI
jgi:large subunit ribosomal protein L16